MHAMSRRLFQLVLSSLLALLIVNAHAATPNSASSRKPLEVVTTTGMLADVIKHVGKDRVRVSALMGTGVDPHTYRQTHADIARLTRADLVIYHGLHLEAQLTHLLQEVARHKPVVALAETLPTEQLMSDEENPGFHDPHIWMDPTLWQQLVLAARDTLISTDPDGRSAYTQNATDYGRQIANMNVRVTAMLHAVPPSGRILVTAHDAFRYFGRAYGYEVLAVQGISTESEASLHQIEQLVNTLVQRKIPAVFVESSVPEQNVRALTEGAAARGHHVMMGGELYSDSMGNPGTPEGSYIGMIEHNARLISSALSAS